MHPDGGDCILLRLDDTLKDPQTGWQFGTNPSTSDVLLGHRGTKGISGRHFHITITEELRIELHDDGSRFGTVVSYDGQGKDLILKAGKRLLSFEPEVQEQWKEIIVYVPDEDLLAFRIEFPNHRDGAKEYRKNLQAFLEECRTSILPLGGLGLESNPTTAPMSRQPRTPSKSPVFYYRGEIVRGSFGNVHKLIDMRTGQFYAAKTFRQFVPKRPMNNKRKLDEKTNQEIRKINQEKEKIWWNTIRNEVDVMARNPHVSLPIARARPSLGVGLTSWTAQHHASDRVSRDTTTSTLDAVLSARES